LQTQTSAFLDLPQTRKELHVTGPLVTSHIGNSGHIAWANYNASGDFVQSAKHILPELLEAGVRVLLFTGQYDECMNVQSTANWMVQLEGWNSTNLTHGATAYVPIVSSSFCFIFRDQQCILSGRVVRLGLPLLGLRLSAS
jgi:carboxypeptidase C (cathepsin A)